MMCSETCEKMTDALEGRLSGKERRAFRLHMLLCPYCQRFKRQLETTIAALRGLPPPEAKDDAREKALQAFRQARKKTT